MFEEELLGSISSSKAVRSRQEEARRRRLQYKNSQQQQYEQKKNDSSTTSSSSNPVLAPARSNRSSAAVGTAPLAFEGGGGGSDKEDTIPTCGNVSSATALTNTNQKPQYIVVTTAATKPTTTATMDESSIIRILQTWLRRVFSRMKSYQESQSLFDQRIQDLYTIQGMLAAKCSTTILRSEGTCRHFIRQCWYIVYYYHRHATFNNQCNPTQHSAATNSNTPSNTPPPYYCNNYHSQYANVSTSPHDIARVSLLLQLVVNENCYTMLWNAQQNSTSSSSSNSNNNNNDNSDSYLLISLLHICLSIISAATQTTVPTSTTTTTTTTSSERLLLPQKYTASKDYSTTKFLLEYGLPHAVHNICTFFRILLKLGSCLSTNFNSNLPKQCNSLVWSTLFSNYTPYHYDLIYHLRTMLLSNCSTSLPTSATITTAIIQEKHVQTKKDKISEIFTLVLDASLYDLAAAVPSRKQQQQHQQQQLLLSHRLVMEIFTIPLLSSQLSAKATETLLVVTASPSTTTGTNTTTSQRPPISIILQSFYASYLPQLLMQNYQDTIFNDIPMDYKKYPFPCAVSLFGNLVSWMVSFTAATSITVTSTITYTLHPTDVTLLLSILTTLIPHLPLSLFQQQSSSGRSAVAWMRDNRTDTSTNKATLTPIVLNEMIVQQCQLLFLDDFVRNMFTVGCEYHENCSTDISSTKYSNLVTSTVTCTTSEDILWESKWIESIQLSTKRLAAREATKKNASILDSTKTREALLFWKSKIHRGAKQLQKGITDVFSSRSTVLATNVKTGEGQLVDTSLVSRQLASGRGDFSKTRVFTETNKKENTTKQKVTNIEAKTTMVPNDVRSSVPYTNLLLALCRLYGSILSRWGGYGFSRNHNTRETTTSSLLFASPKAEPISISLLNVLCFSTKILSTSWSILSSNLDEDCAIKNEALRRQIKNLTNDRLKMDETPLHALKILPINCYSCAEQKTIEEKVDVGPSDAAVLLMMFSCCLSHTLVVTDDADLYEADEPIPKLHLRRYINLTRKLIFRALWLDEILPSMCSTRSQKEYCLDSNCFGLSVIATATRALRDLYDRSSRRPICAPDLWVIDDLLEKEVARCKTHEDYVALLHTPLLRRCPFLVPFKRRLKLFDRIVTTDRISKQGSNETQNLKPGRHVRILRGRILEDGITHLNSLGKDLRQRIVVSYYNQAGTVETGLDVGGLFKEFWTDLSALAFDPNFGLFRITEGGDNCLFPNPSSVKAHGDDHLMLFGFLGRILGKALYEGITINPQLAHFFLAFLRGDYNFLHMLNDLKSMDSELHHNLMFLKNYEGDVSDMCLTFTVSTDDFGASEEKELIPNGFSVEVTNHNKQRYIGLVAKYYVCDRIRLQSEAFTRGLWEVIESSWLRLFDPNELQVLISGSSDEKLDIADLRKHTRYVAGYTGLDVNIIRFWSVASKMSCKNQRDLLRFVTSCERPPPLGFVSLNPPFTIQRIPISDDESKLPSASTCFNTLKLPTYSSEKILKEKLIYAIESSSGFELT